MLSQQITSRAFGALFALAATLSSMLAPAYAATPLIDSQVVQVSQAATTIRTSDRMEALDALTFQPDVRVKYIGPGYNNGKYLFRFRVENIGAASADDFMVDEDVHQTSYDGSTGLNQSVGGPLLSLASGQSTIVTVSCTPKPGYVCTGASVEAIVADDLDPSNNRAHSK